MPERAVPAAPTAAPFSAPIVAAIAIGGAAGGYLRVALSLLPGTGSPASWPLVTLAVNLTGSFVLALTVSLLYARGRPASLWRALVGTGFCGALTTFSALQLEAFCMLRADHVGLALAYLGASVLGGLAAVVAGIALGRRVG